MEILTKYGLELLFGLISAASLAFCRYIWKQKKELEKNRTEEFRREQRQMILDELEPIIEEIERVKIKTAEEMEKIKKFHEEDMDNAIEEIRELEKAHHKKMNMIISSYKFRFIQLCKIHIRDEYVTQDEFDQITEFYKLYSGLGGNGQAQEYYEKVLDLPIVEKK